MPIILNRDHAVELMETLRMPQLDSYVIALFVNNFIPNLDSAWAAFVEATFPGYARIAISTPNPAFLSGVGRGEVDANVETFTATGANAETVYGYALLAVGDVVKWCERFNAPINMNAPGSSLDLGIKFTGFTEFTG